MTRALLLAVIAAGCASPRYGSGDLRCAPSGRRCPDGFYCAADDRCWAMNGGPDLRRAVQDLAMPADLVMRGDGGGATPSKCSSSTALLCDGFEGGALDPQWQPGGSVSIDTSFAYRGTRSIHVHTDAAAANSDPSGGITETRTFPINGTAWVRIWAFFPDGYPVAFNQMINFTDASTTGASYCMKSFQPISNDYAETTSAGYKTSSFTIPTGKWVCLKMSLSQPGPTGDMHVYIGDTDLPDATLTGVKVTQAVSLALGADFFSNPMMGASDMWIDEVIVDSKPIMCGD